MGAACRRPARRRITGARRRDAGCGVAAAGADRRERGGPLQRLRRPSSSRRRAGRPTTCSASSSASSYDLRASGLAGYVAIASATVREAMTNAVRYGALRDTSAVYALEDGDGLVRFRIDSRSAHMRGSRQATEFKAALVLAACHRWIGAGFRPLEMRFAHPRGAVAARHRAASSTVRCASAAEATEMVLSPEQLDLPVRGADPHLLALRHRPRRGGAGRGRQRPARRAAGARRADGAGGSAEGGADARAGRGRRSGSASGRWRGGSPARGRRSGRSSTRCAATWRRAIWRIRSSVWRRSPICSDMPSRAPSPTRSGAGPGGRRGGFGWKTRTGEIVREDGVARVVCMHDPPKERPRDRRSAG